MYTCGGNESNRKTQNRFKHSGETIGRKFDEVLNAWICMAKEFIRPKIPTFTLLTKGLEMIDMHGHTSKIALCT
jgi:hypothetical protein